MSRRLLVDDRQPAGASAEDPIWKRLRELIAVVNNGEIVFGRLLDAELDALPGSGLAISTTPRSIPHKLGRRAKGFFEILSSDLGDGGLGLKPVSHPQGITSEHYITVQATTPGRCFIWVY
ncbi:MAG TPA: hypothetical protein VFN70_18175 [Burkholderiales bacterium]|nr:hypothetical protein [Burkholderiales bacterium]